MVFMLKKDDVIFLQTSAKLLKGVLNIKKISGFKVVYLIHDMFCLRYDNYDQHKFEIRNHIELLNQCEYVICHNSKMKEKLIEFGCRSSIFEIGIFDYIIEESLKTISQCYKPVEIAFAGNLAKSFFLHELNNLKTTGVSFNVYGLPKYKFSNLNYKGSVQPEELPFVIEGNYGLIWEGDYCAVEKDNYTRYNNPHKASLYIVSGLPLIVWSKSAIADFVTKNNIGITIDCLDDIESAILKIKETEYKKMVENIGDIRAKLSKGYYLKSCLDLIE